MIEKVKKTIRHYKMFEPSERVVVAVSGGPDSVALLHVLNQLNVQLCLKISVAHLDHNLRRASSRDLSFVKTLARSFDLPFYDGVLHWGKGRRKDSEDGLRKKRYSFLLSVCSKTGAKKIALGHTKDDQAETVLMRLLRGSGLYGLSAILPKRPLGSCQIVRPLIEVPRSQIMHYLRKNKIAYRIDETNLRDNYVRNKIRNHLLPMLERDYNPGIRDVLSGLALTVGADYKYLHLQLRDFLHKKTRRSKSGYSLDIIALKNLDLSLRRLALRISLESLQGDLRRMTFKHWQEIEELLEARPRHAEVHLPNHICVSKGRNRLNIFKR